MTSSANLIPSMEKQAQTLAEEMNKAECHMAYTWLSEQFSPLLRWLHSVVTEGIKVLCVALYFEGYTFLLQTSNYHLKMPIFNECA